MSLWKSGQRAVVVSCLLSLSAGCASTGKSAPTAGTAGTKNGTEVAALTQDEAIQRAKEVSDVHYRLWFGIDADRTEFDGKTRVSFHFAPQGRAELPLDLEAGAIRSVAINDKPLSATDAAARFNGHRFTLKAVELQAGAENTVEITYTHPYSTDGDGFYRFRDPVDGKVYLFTHFEPFFAHRLFPCFDQPDLKATYDLSVQAPGAWQVISNTRENAVAHAGTTATWTFPRSPVFSTYLFALHAGPYQRWASQANVKGAGVIPTRLFARASLAKFVDSKEWLQVTAQGLSFYSNTFGFPYPFKKYDQILVPDFNAGAMENVAAVTFAERYTHRSKITWDERRNRANVILHEMAHMWFGDLVTMKWWDGLWLNESFATFMASWAVNDATQFKPAWQDFYRGSKRSAYREDQLVTTHPIQTLVADTSSAFASFDGITYGKGASTLKQLSFLLGQKNFTEGLRSYFHTYAYSNTTIGDFIGKLSDASGRDLGPWRKAWLETASLNRIEAEWACDPAKGVISSFVLKQEGSPENPLLREHKTEIGLFYGQPGGKLTAKETASVDYSQARTEVPALVGMACPLAVFPNQEDYDYVKVSLDPVSLSAMKADLAKIDTSFARQMIWGSLVEMMVDARIAPQEFAALVFSQAPKETDTQVLSAALDGLIYLDPRQASSMKFMTDKLHAEFEPKVEAFTREGLAAAAPGSDLQLIWYRHYLWAVHSNEGSTALLAWLSSGKGAPRGLKIDQDRRWEIIQTLARNGVTEGPALIQAELAKDPSDQGRKQAIGAEAELPQADERAQWLARIFREDSASGGQHYRYAELREAMRSFYVLDQEQFIRQATDPYFSNLPRLVRTSGAQDEEYISRLSGAMFPPLCDASIIQKATLLLDQNHDLPAPVVKNVKIGRQDVDRCIHARELSASLR